MAKKDTTPQWLKEIKLAAQYNYLRHRKEQLENQRVAAAQRDGNMEELVKAEMAKVKSGEEKKSTKSEVKKEGK